MEGIIFVIVSFTLLHVLSGASNGLSVPVRLHNCTGFGNTVFYTVQENLQEISLFIIDGITGLNITSGNNGDFGIVEASNTWTIKTNGPLDFETKNQYDLLIDCSDLHKRNLQYPLIVRVIDVVEGDFTLHYEKKNKFKVINYSSSEAIVNVPEDTATGTDILKLNATSAKKEKLDLLWNITKDCVLEVNVGDTLSEPHENRLTLGQNVSYDDNIHNTCICMVFVCVKDHPEFNRTLKVTVKIQDVDNKNPKFNQTHYTAKIPENATRHQEVIRISAFDQDFGINQKILYEIVDPLNSMFTITNKDNTTAIISVAGKLDREKQSMVTLVVKAYQKDKPEFRQDFAVVQINITDVNDNRPVMSQNSYNVSIPENMLEGQTVLWVNASDADEGTNATFTFELSCTMMDAFAIDQLGKIKVKNSSILDTEKTQSIRCKVHAKENNTKETFISSNSTITIQLTDVNDNNPIFNQKTYAFPVTDNAPVVGQVHAYDSDITTTTNGKVTYEIIQGQGNDAKLFQMNTSSGEISKSAEWKGCVHLPRYVDIHVTASDNPSAVSMKRLTGLF